MNHFLQPGEVSVWRTAEEYLTELEQTNPVPGAKMICATDPDAVWAKKVGPARMAYLDNYHSRLVYAGIPLLLAAVQSFAIEYESIMDLGPLPTELSADSLANLMRSRYDVSGDLLEDLQDLIEIRNEIIHPVPRPPGTADNWPDYLRRVKQKGLLSTTGNPNADFIMLGQIASHRLFTWAIEVTRKLYDAIINSNSAKIQKFQLFSDNFEILFG